MTEAGAEIAADTPVRQRLRSVGARLHPGVRGLWTWWTRALASWLPPGLRIVLGIERRRLVLVPHAGGLQLALDRDGQLHALGDLPPGDIGGPEFGQLLPQRLAALPRWLVLPAEAALRRQMMLPAAAADRLRDVLGFEIDRQTPFAADAVHFDTRLLGRLDDGRLEVELVAAPREALDSALAQLGPLAQGLAGVDLDDGGGQPLGVNLLPAARRHRRQDPSRRWNLVLVVVSVACLALAMWQVLENRRMAADAFEQASQAQFEQARAVATRRARLAGMVEGVQKLQAERAGRPTMVEVLDELTGRLPDDTYLEKLAVENDRLLLIGLSGEASALVKALEDSPLWRSPALAGALQPDPRTRRDRFTVTAELVVSDAAAVAQGGPGARRDP